MDYLKDTRIKVLSKKSKHFGEVGKVVRILRQLDMFSYDEELHVICDISGKLFEFNMDEIQEV